MSSKHIRRRYEFDKGLATGQMLDILANDPILAALAELKLPGLGEKTNGSITDARGMMVFGAASVLWGSDRRAEVELADQWPIRRPVFDKAGIRTSVDAPNAAAWQYYRDTYLTEDVVADLKEVLRDLWVGQARKMGLFPTQSEHDWMEPDHLHTVYADGTWFAPASRTNIRGQKSKAKTGEPRVSEGNSIGGKLDGYCSVWMLARRPEPRMRMILDFAGAPAGGEMPVALDSLEALRSRVGDGLRQFVYDGALRGHDQVTRIVEMGVLPIGKPDAVDSFADWDVRGKPLRSKILNFDFDFSGCVHRLAADYGMLWHLEHDGELWRYGKRAVVESVERRKRPDGSYTFDVDLRLRCNSSWHELRVDLTEPLVVDGGRRSVRLAAHVKAHPMADIERFASAYGIRNDAESGFARFKNYLGIGSRAGSFTRLAHDIDLLLLALTSNALAWAEWRQEYAASTARYRVTRCLTSPRMAGV